MVLRFGTNSLRGALEAIMIPLHQFHYNTLHFIALLYTYSTDMHVLAIMQADHCRACPYNTKVMFLYLRQSLRCHT
jgi:hypothetical protein